VRPEIWEVGLIPSFDDQARLDDLMRAGGLPYDRAERVIAGWVDLLERLHPDTFWTITFDHKKCGFAHSGQNAVDRSEWVINKVAKSVGCPLPSFIVAEQHIDGAYHCHGLSRIAGLTGELDWMIRKALWETAFAKYGRNEFREIESIGGVRGYVSKYVVKSRADWKIISPKHWF
jgi:hypothetical protein